MNTLKSSVNHWFRKVALWRIVLIFALLLLSTTGFNVQTVKAGTNPWVSTGSLITGRLYATAILLDSGKVLVPGGTNGSAALKTTELYNPSTGTWSSTGSMKTARLGYAIVKLSNGKVLIAGGSTGSAAISAAEIYDPATGTWSDTANALPTALAFPEGVLLANGKALIVGGTVNGTAGSALSYLYDPATNQFTSAGTMTTGRWYHSVTLLPNGKVLVAGGSSGDGSTGLSSVELYDPSTGWAAGGSLPTMNVARHTHTATLLSTGKVLVAGGTTDMVHAIGSAELYDPSDGSWTLTGTMTTKRYLHSAVLLSGGEVLVAGGSDDDNILATAETYNPAAGTWSSVGYSMSYGRIHFAAAWLNNNTVLEIGGTSSGSDVLTNCNLYDNRAVATITLGNLSQTYDGTPRPVTVTTNPAGQEGDVIVTYSGTGYGPTTTPPTNAGSYSLTAKLDSTTYRGTGSGTLMVAKATASVLIGSLSQTYNGSPKSVTVTTNPSGKPVTVTYEGTGGTTYTQTTTPPTNAGTYTVVATVNDPNYSGTNTGTLTIAKANQTITFASLVDKVYGDGDFDVSASADSGLTVSFSVGVGDPCSVSGHTIHISGTGTCNVTASQSGNTNYNAAAPVPRSFVISKANQTISFSPLLNKTFGDPDFTVSATATSGLTVSFSVGLGDACTVTGNTIHLTGAGHCNVTASQIGNANYNAATPVAQGFDIAMGHQTITFASLPDKKYGDPDFTVNATASSGLPVSFGVGASDDCTISGNTIHLTSIGSCTVTASQAGNSNYYAATPVSRTFAIKANSATVQLDNLNQIYDGSPKSASVTTDPTGLSTNVTYEGISRTDYPQSTTPPTGAGTYDVIATITDPNYAGGANGTLNVAKANQTINFAALGDKTYGDADFSVSAIASSGLTVGFSVGVSDSCMISGTTIHITGAGSCTVTAAQTGNSNYNAASPISRTFQIAKANATVVLNNLNQTYNGSPRPVSVTTTPAGLNVSINYESSDLRSTVQTITPPTDVGTYTVSVMVNDANYTGSANGTLNINKANQLIVFSALANKTYGDADFQLDATASSGLPVTFTVTSGTACTVSGSTVHITGAGSCSVTASQEGTNNYNPATPVVRAFQVARSSASVGLSNLNQTYTGSPISATVITTPADLSVSLNYEGVGDTTYSKSATPPTNAGVYNVTAEISDPNYQGMVTGTLIIQKADAVITFGDLTQIYDGTPRAVRITTDPSGLNVTLTYTGTGGTAYGPSSTPPTEVGKYTVIATVDEENYQGTATDTLIISTVPDTGGSTIYLPLLIRP